MILKNQKDNSNNNQDNNDMLIKYEFEQLLKYKQKSIKFHHQRQQKFC